MYSLIRGLSRRFLLGFCIFNTGLFVLEILPIGAGKWNELYLLLWLISTIVTLCWLVVDAGMVYYFLRRISVVKGSRSFVQTFFLDGCSWTHLGAHALKIDQFVQEIGRRTTASPGLYGTVMETLRIHGAAAAFALIEQAQMQNQKAAVVANIPEEKV